jgi:hypothetical protein
MFCKEAVPIIDPPRSIEQLADFDLRLCIRTSMRTWRKIHDEPSDSNTVIITDHRTIAKANQSIQIEFPGDLSPRLLGFSGRDGKPTVKPREKAFEEAIRSFEGLNPLKAQLGNQPILQDPKESLNASLGLWGEGRDGPNAQGFQR